MGLPVADIASFVADPFEAEFVRTGMFAAMLVGVLCAVVGSFVVIRGSALLADSFAHGVLPGVAIAVIVGSASPEPGDLAILAGGLGGAVVTALGTGLILRRSGLRDDTAAAVMFVFMLALGVVLISSASNYAVDLNAFLFGDVLAVDGADLPLIAGLAAAVIAFAALLYKPAVLVSFDPRRAASLGLDVGRVELALMLLLAAAVVVGFRVVGSLLVIGLLIAPPAAAAMVTRRIPSMMALAAVIAIVSAPLGMLISWHADVAAGASIVLVAVGVCLTILALRPAVR